MSRRRSISFKELAERKYPWRVDVEVPPGGLGARLNAMMDWCRERKADWAQHGQTLYVRGEIPQDFARFYFLTEPEAMAFKQRWGGKLSSV